MKTSLRSFLRSDTAFGLALALAAFVVYLLTLSRSIGPEDAGELAASAYTLGNSHPTGYPLFHLLGRIFTLLPLGELRVIVKLNLMGAVLCSAAVYVAWRLFLVLLQPGVLGAESSTAHESRSAPASKTAQENQETKNKALSKLVPHDISASALITRIAAGGGVLALAFSRVVWANATMIEVYALHFLFVGIVIWLFVRANESHRNCLRQPNPVAIRRAEILWQLAVYVLGLSFANHMMTVLLAPAFLWLYFSSHGYGRTAWMKIARGIPAFALALSAYLYLPIRAMVSPLRNWGDPVVFERFWAHVSGDQYRDRMFSSLAVAIKKSGEFLRELPVDFGYLPLLFVLIGLVVAWRKHRHFTAFTGLIFVTAFVYAVNYDFEDPNFRLNAHFMVGLWTTLGIITATSRLAKSTDSAQRTVAFASSLALASATVPLATNYTVMDESDNYAVEDFVRNGLESVEPDAVIVSGTFIEFTFAAWYLQQVEGVRRDVLIADYTLLGLTWYYLQLENARPALSSTVRRLIRENINRERPLPQVMQGTRLHQNADPYHLAFIRAFLETWHPLAPVYIAGLVPDGALGDFYDVPQGLVKRLYIGLPAEQPLTFFSLRPLPRKDTRHVHNVRGAYAEAYYNQALYRFFLLADATGAATLSRKALELRPEFPEARTLLSQAMTSTTQRNLVPHNSVAQ